MSGEIKPYLNYYRDRSASDQAGFMAIEHLSRSHIAGLRILTGQ